MEKQFQFSLKNLYSKSQIEKIRQEKITEITIYDEKLSKNKNQVLQLLNFFSVNLPDVFLNLLIDINVIDRDVVDVASKNFCSLDISLNPTEKNEKFLFDKKFYAKKANLLNDYGIVFGFYLTYATSPYDSLKLFLERLDFAVNQYPNHLDFPQTENNSFSEPKVSGNFSAKDIRYARDIAFSCRTFYTEGRAVPWFLSVLKPLKIYPSKFFADFAEWQRCNNCDFRSGFNPEAENHKSIEKMQILFLDEKYEEKGRKDLLTLVRDVVTLNGAMSRLTGENEKSEIALSYNPDDLLSEEILNLNDFAENVCMTDCKVKIYFDNNENPTYSVES